MKLEKFKQRDSKGNKYVYNDMHFISSLECFSILHFPLLKLTMNLTLLKKVKEAMEI